MMDKITAFKSHKEYKHQANVGGRGTLLNYVGLSISESLLYG